MTFTPPRQLRDRIKAARDRGKLREFDYVKRSKDVQQDGVVCKGCGTVLAKWRPDDRFRETKVINGQRTIFERMIQVQTLAYTEIKMDFDDGSTHVTPVCKSCSKRLQSADLEDIYAADLSALLQEKGPKEYILGNVRSRVPVSFTIVED